MFPRRWLTYISRVVCASPSNLMFFVPGAEPERSMEGWNGTSGNDLATTQQTDDQEDFYDTFLQESRFWIQRVLLPLVVFVGIIGNGKQSAGNGSIWPGKRKTKQYVP